MGQGESRAQPPLASDISLRYNATVQNCYNSGSEQTRNIPYVNDKWDYISGWNKDFPEKVYQQWPVGQYYAQSDNNWNLVDKIHLATNEDPKNPKIFQQDKTPGPLGEKYDYIYLYNQNLLPVVPKDMYPVNKSPAALAAQDTRKWDNRTTSPTIPDVSNSYKYDSNISQRINLNSHSNYPMFTREKSYNTNNLTQWKEGGGNVNHPIIETKWFSVDPMAKSFDFNNANQATLDTCGYFFKSRRGPEWEQHPPILANLIKEPAGDWQYWINTIGDTQGNKSNAGGTRQNCYIQNLGRSSPGSYVNIAGIDYKDFVLDETSTTIHRPECGLNASPPLKNIPCPKTCPTCATMPDKDLIETLRQRWDYHWNPTPNPSVPSVSISGQYEGNKKCATQCTIQDLPSSFKNTTIPTPNNLDGLPPWCFTDINHRCSHDARWGFCSPCEETYDNPVKNLEIGQLNYSPNSPNAPNKDSIPYSCAGTPINPFQPHADSPAHAVPCPSDPLPSNIVAAPCSLDREELIKDCYKWVRSKELTDSGGQNQSLIWQWSPDPVDECGKCTSIAFINRLSHDEPGAGMYDFNKKAGAYEDLYPYWQPNDVFDQGKHHYDFGYSGVILPTKRQEGWQYKPKNYAVTGCQLDETCTPFDRLSCNLLRCSSGCSSPNTAPKTDPLTNIVPASYSTGLLDYMYYDDAMFLSGSRRFKIEDVDSMDECYKELQKAKQSLLMATRVNTYPKEGAEKNAANLYKPYCPDYQPIWANYSPKQKTCEIYNVRKDNNTGNDSVMWVGGSWYQDIDPTDDYFDNLLIDSRQFGNGRENGKPVRFKCGDYSMGVTNDHLTGGFMSILSKNKNNSDYTCKWYKPPTGKNNVYNPPPGDGNIVVDQYAFNNRDGNDPLCKDGNPTCKLFDVASITKNLWTPGDDNDNKFLIDAEPLYRQLKDCCMGKTTDEDPCPSSTVPSKGVPSSKDCDAIMEGWCKAYHASHPDEDYPDECKCISAAWIFVDRTGHVVPEGTPNSMSLSQYNDFFLPPEIVKANKSVYCSVLPCQAGFFKGKPVYIPSSYFNNRYECPTGICSQIVNVIGNDNTVQLKSNCKDGHNADGTPGRDNFTPFPTRFADIINYLSVITIIFIIITAIITFIFKKPKTHLTTQ